MIAQIGAVKPQRLPCADPISGAFAVRVAFTGPHGDQSRPILRVDFESKGARACDRERKVRCIDLNGVTRIYPPHLYLQRALRDFQLPDAVIEIEKRDACERTEPH
jgi:hypothetical protein